MKKLLLLSLALLTSETVPNCISVHAHKPFIAKYVNSKKGCVGLCAKQKVYTKFNGTWRQGTKVSICDCCKPTKQTVPTCISVDSMNYFPDTEYAQASQGCPAVCAKQKTYKQSNGSWDQRIVRKDRKQAVSSFCGCCLPTNQATQSQPTNQATQNCIDVPTVPFERTLTQKTANDVAQKDCPNVCAKHPTHKNFNGAWYSYGAKSFCKCCNIKQN